jgi:hypothetical protein
MFSELFGVVSALRRNASRHEYGGYSQAESKYLPLGSREGTLVFPRRASRLSGMPNSPPTLLSRCTEIADGRFRVFKYLSRFKTNIIAF